jgi:glycosyltransferase involved in cell wall biosynthesis
MRVLLIAESANPERVSVPLVGWSHCRALLDVVDGHVVTQVRNLEAFERAGLSRDRFTPIDSEAVARPMHRLETLLRGGANKGWTTVVALRALSNAYFERLVWRAFEGRLRDGEFDVVHRVIPVSPTIPSSLAARCARAGVPFVVGPLNGGLPWAPGFGGTRRKEREWLSYLRGAYKALPGYGSMRRHASAIVAGSRHTLSEMPKSAMERCVYLPENAIDPGLFPAPVRQAGGRPVRVAFVGRLVPYKGADILVEAAAPQVRAGKLTVEIIGEGPERGRLEELIRRLGVRDGVTLTGWVAHAKLHERLGRADVFGFPSIREFGGAVVLEAMALGCVPVVVDYGGPAEMVTPTTGYVVPMGTREQIVGSFASVFETVVAMPDGIRPMGEAARRRVLTSFTWDAKARQTLEIYRWVRGERESKPDFGMPLADVSVQSAIDAPESTERTAA